VVSAAAALAACGLVASLVMASSPRPNAEAGYTAVTTAASNHAGAPTAAKSPTQAAALSTPRPPVTTSEASPSTTPATSSPQATSASAPLAGRIQPDVAYRGVATEYSAGNGDGACLFGPASTMMIAAMNYTDYDTAKACGAYVLVHAAGGVSITVLITNECPAPCAPGQLDLSQQAFAKLANPAAGRIPITWQLISPGISTTISIRYKTGSSQWWCALQVIGHRNPVAQLEVHTSSGWQQLPRTGYNYFLSANGNGCGNTIRITDIYGQQLTVNALPIWPDVEQPAQVQFSPH
jgi:expansin